MEQEADQMCQLCKLCREGRLFEVEQWCKEGKPVDFHHRNPRLTPIGIAIDRNFHSLVEVLLRHGVSGTGLPLRQAVRHAKASLVELLLRYGADPKSVSFADVIYCGHPEIVKMFIERGADIITGYPIAEGLKRATRSFLNVYKTYIEKRPELHLQANITLRHFCSKGSLRGVCLLLWLGANPRALAPSKFGEAEDIWNTALIDAVCRGQFEIVKKIGIDPRLDDLNKLLGYAAISKSAQVVEHLIELGADPNYHQGDEWPLKTAVWWLWSTLDLHRDYLSECARAMDVVRAFASGGAKFRPEEPTSKELRRCLLKMQFHEAIELIEHLKQVGAAEDRVFMPLLKPPGLHNQLPCHMRALRRLFPGHKDLKPSNSS